MHTDTTLAILDDETTALGNQLHEFKSTTCPAFETQELSREMKARERRESKKPSSSTTPSGPQKGHRPKTFNMQTYKCHSLGDYVFMIKRYGTTDSYTTAIVSCLPFIAAI